MKRWFIVNSLRLLLKKSTRDRIPLSGEAARNNDDYVINLEGLPDEPEKSFLVREVGTEKVTLSYWDGKEAHESEIGLDQVDLKHIKIIHYWKAWRTEHSSVIVAVLYEIFKINWIRRAIQKQYEKKLQAFNDRHQLLQLLQQYRKPWPNDGVELDTLLEHLYGPRIHMSEKKYNYGEALSFVLNSLEASGDAEATGEQYVEKARLTPQGLATLSDYSVESSRHTDTLKITWYQLLVAVAMALLGIATLFVQIVQLVL